ncbi:MAG: Arylsulfatase [Planctomycetota bacterium]
MTTQFKLKRSISGLLTFFAIHTFTLLPAETVEQPPNIVLIFADDLGYGDLPAFFDQTQIKTPNIDRLISQGTKFTDFYVSQPVCTASRASLMTGCYANRVGLSGALNHTSPNGINPNEEILPELLKKQGYATAMFGKWHLGLPPFFSPLSNGFDEWLGIPYSNDNSKYHPVLASSMPPLPLYDGNNVVETDPDQALFTKRLTERAVAFIRKNQAKPFFLYVPHIMPHVPIFASDSFRGKSASGLYGDVIEELDWSVGQILETIDSLELSQNTLVIFTSDNGPFLSYGSHAGSAGKFRGGKLTTFEGGVRVPAVMRWTGKIPAGEICKTPVMTIDFLPTICSITGAKMPEAIIDGKDITYLLIKPQQVDGESSRALVFYSGNALQAIRLGKWKLHLPHPYLVVNGETRTDGKPAGFGKLAPQSITNSGIEGIASRHGYLVRQLPLALYDLESDPSESVNIAKEHPDVVTELSNIAEKYRKKLGDSATSVVGSEIRENGKTPDLKK